MLIGSAGTASISPEATARAREHSPRDERDEMTYNYNTLIETQGIDRGGDKYQRAFEYAFMWLMGKRPFYAHIFYDAVRRRTHKIPTLCVLIQNARIELWYNPDFLALHTLQQNVGFLQHEAGHILAGHLSEKTGMKGNGPPPPYLDLAMDLSVDSLIQARGDQPEWVILPRDVRIPEEDVDPEKWRTAREHQTWLYYQRILAQGDPLARLMEKMKDRPLPDGLDLSGLFAAMGSGAGAGGGGLGSGSHDKWDEGDPPDVQDQVVTSTIKKAYQRSGSTMRGYMHGNLVEMIEDKLKDNSVPFERIVRAFVGGHIRVGHKSTPMRVSRRRYIPPGNTYARGLDILYGADDSGSMASEEVALGRSEMYHLTHISGVRVRFQRFCAGLVGDLVDLENADWSGILERANGGTDFNAIIDLAHELKPDLLMIMTDGGAPEPSRPPPCPMAWILTHDGVAHSMGTIIRLPTIEDIRRGYRAVIERWAPK